MRFRTRLFLIWGGVILLLYAGTCFPVLRSIELSFDRMAAHAFLGTRRDLQSLQAERVRGIRQAAAMVMNIPELRALIAEHNFEVSAENNASLQERLDNLAGVVGVSFVCVLDARGSLIAQNHSSPWASLPDLQSFLATSPQGKAMVAQVFGQSNNPRPTASTDIFGVWGYQKHVYQVVGVPLVFNSDSQPRPGTDGALIMAAPLTDDLAASLAQSQSCQVSFLADGGIAASNLAPAVKTELQTQFQTAQWPLNNTFDISLGGVAYRSSMDPMIDPCSGSTVGFLLIQSDLKESISARQKVSKRLLASMIGGLFAAAIASFVVSAAVTKPVRELSLGVQRLAESDLDVTVAVRDKGELGALAAGFNDMVRQLRARRELERLVEESRAMTRAKSQFLANMSHEIRTPLNGVIGMAELLLRTTLNDRQRRYAGMVKSSAEVLTTLINDILDFSKMEAGKLELEAVDFNLHELVEDVVELLGIKAQAKGLQVAADIDPQTPAFVRGDPTRLRQVLVNLMNNAVKFTDRGEVIIRLSNSGENETKGLRFEVIDSGIGIPAERMNRLFQSFSQVDASTTRRYGGTGLGLAICKQLVELMGGKIGVTSEAGRGSTFWFTAPLEAQPYEQSAEEKEMAARLAGLRALIVDADPTAGHILRRTMTAWGLNTETASGTAEGIAAVEAARSQDSAFRFVILDRGQSDAGGESSLIDFCKAGSESILRLAPLGAEADSSGELCITKPIRRRQLLQTLTTALSGNANADSALATDPANEPPTPAPLSTIRILVAEDNPINQMITNDLVTGAGYACDVVSDGRAAVAAFERGGYDLILMDCQMPEMDGFEAAGAIRALERAASPADQTPRRSPIIALTAHSGAEDRARCLDAGMDDYCTKPFVVDRFLETIRSRLPVHNVSGISSTAHALTPSPGTPGEGRGEGLPLQSRQDPHPNPLPAYQERGPEAITPPVDSSPPFDLDSLLGRCAGNGNLAMAILAKFETQAAQVISDLQRQMEQSAFEDAGRTAHRLKGTAGILSADAMRGAAVRVEELSAARDAGAFADGLDQFQREIARCVAYIQTARTALRKTDESRPQLVEGIR